MAEVVVDASALVDLLLRNELGAAVSRRLAGEGLHAPAHVDAEVLSAVGRLSRAGDVAQADVSALLARMVAAPIERHPVADLLNGAWSRQHQLRLADALYVTLADVRGIPLVTTDRRLRSIAGVEIVVVSTA